MIKKYRTTETTTHLREDNVPEGTICYTCKGYDYGCASDDTRGFGVKFVSVTLKEDGDYPFFTIPVDYLEEIKDVPN